MQNRQSVKAIGAADAVHSIFLIEAPSLQQSRNGPYWRLGLRDATGSVEAKIWSPLSQEIPPLASGQCAEVEGRASLYREQIQITVESLRLLSEEERDALDVREFMPASPRPPQEMWEELLTLCKTVLTHKPWRDFVCGTLKDTGLREDICAAPAAKSIHHAYAGGLLEHTLSVSQLVLRMCDQYPLLDRQTLFAGAVFHDIGKVWEYSGGLANDYTDAGRLLGHTALALEYLEPRLAQSALDAGLIQHFKHLILSHHGSAEYGAARLPQTPEAFLLHFADNIDAKMAQCQSLFANGEPDAIGWSAYQKTLDRYIYQPKRTPSQASPQASPEIALTTSPTRSRHSERSEESSFEVSLTTSPKTSREATEQCLSLLKV